MTFDDRKGGIWPVKTWSD